MVDVHCDDRDCIHNKYGTCGLDNLVLEEDSTIGIPYCTDFKHDSEQKTKEAEG